MTDQSMILARDAARVIDHMRHCLTCCDETTAYGYGTKCQVARDLAKGAGIDYPDLLSSAPASGQTAVAVTEAA